MKSFKYFIENMDSEEPDPHRHPMTQETKDYWNKIINRNAVKRTAREKLKRIMARKKLHEKKEKKAHVWGQLNTKTKPVKTQGWSPKITKHMSQKELAADLWSEEGVSMKGHQKFFGKSKKEMKTWVKHELGKRAKKPSHAENDY